MILKRRPDLWAGAAGSIVNFLVLLGVLDWTAEVTGGFNLAFAAVLALLANTGEGSGVLEARSAVTKWAATRKDG